MPLGEFELIARYFTRPGRRGDVLLGVGDDAAVLDVPAGQALVVATDTLVEGRHFLADAPPQSVGHQALAVNLSDLAAMGAQPAWALLALSVPDADEAWIDGFSRGFHALADAFGVELVGGDTVRGPRVVTIQALGFVPPGQALKRSGARRGDVLYVSGTVGDAAAGLELARRCDAGAMDATLLRRYRYAEPRVALGIALRGVASAAIDVSDGLLGDLGKLCRASGVSAEVQLERLPLSRALLEGFGATAAERMALSGGDDYELLFTLPASAAPAIEARLAGYGRITRIGVIGAGRGIRCFRSGLEVEQEVAGHDHFAA
ncbi:MAG TPA: thiamine-phosphate kinase [Steroidobacteraceae bacterium]